MANETTQPKIRTLQGTVVSDKMTKTVVVQVGRLKKDPKYKKYFKVSARYKAHDEKGEYHTGDVVTIQETRPLSKEKRWIVIAKVK
jgi:small subunit ribosomal protein S17